MVVQAGACRPGRRPMARGRGLGRVQRAQGLPPAAWMTELPPPPARARLANPVPVLARGCAAALRWECVCLAW